ncbi:MAG: tetratricopeptide repeat protein [Planctomycetota bacterium]|nr:MAG: tetratricopeptide repeat protein [Planctomycetota bacterium]
MRRFLSTPAGIVGRAVRGEFARLCCAVPWPFAGLWKILTTTVARNLDKGIPDALSAKLACFLSECTFGGDHPNTLVSLFLVIRTRRATVDDAELEPLYRRAAELVQAEYQGPIPGTRTSYRQLASLYQKAENHAMVARVLERLLPLEERAWIRRKPRVAVVLNDLAKAYEHRDDWEKAERCYRRGLDLLGTNHPAITAILSGNLATLYHRQHEFARAEDLYRRALSIRETTLADDVVGLADIVERYGVLCHDRRDFPRAESLFRRASALYDEASDHVADAARVHLLLGRLYYDRGQKEKARQSLAAALAAWESRCEPESPDFLKACWNLAEEYHARGDIDQAESLYRRVLGILENIDAVPPLDVAHVLFRLADIHYDRERFLEAEPLCLRALEIVERTQGPNDPFAEILHGMLTAIRRKRNAALRPKGKPVFFCSGKR